ncbi:hypothetical protein, partial [Tritonibacter sp. SIMBA_163]|uniref:hypothetical protein n=1 Tax=Tritonibacter sp. SIMBA_163 TaxID=3080868 RepID=UPI0039818099
LRLDVSGLNNRLDYVQNWNETLSGQIDQLSDSVTRARSRVIALEAERDSLQSELRTAYSRLNTEQERTAHLEILLRDAHL